MNWFWAQGGWGVITSIAVFVIHLAVVCRAITRPHRSAASRVAWIAVIMFLPIVGVIAYLFLGETSVGRERIRRAAEAEQEIARPDDSAVLPHEADATALTLFHLTESINALPATVGNRITLAADSDAAIDELVADIDAARSTVHISFYIWLDDTNGRKVAAAICRAAARGVVCRLMIDALGSRAFLKTATCRSMRDAGAHVVAALDDVMRLGNLAVGRVDLRNHRKIVVIDDRIAYCGSQNCADPAFEVKPRFAPWVDVFFRTEGPVVEQQQWIFLTSWAAESGEIITPDAVRAHQPDRADGAIAAVFGTGPTVRAGAMSSVFVACIEASRRELVITTPYFAPDEPLLQAICSAPRRGVDTTLILPEHNDSALVAATARSEYPALLDAGVKLFEYPDGLLHSKTITLDGRISLVGSANMDRRSLELNYENNMLVADEQVTAVVRARQQVYLDASSQVPPERVAGWSFGRRLVDNTVGMLAPIL